ncbi:MAG: DUF1007 family protein [Deltaproteobacteria bacterium]|nr:DUF1007 family protein [Candidatus Anaeroferrophillacea bacterium]
MSIAGRAAGIAVLVALLSVIAVMPAFSHPHVFISQRITVEFDEKGLAGFRIAWWFDEFSSTMMVGDFDRDGDGRLSREERARMEKEASASLAEYHFFISATIVGKPFTPRYVRDFAVTQDGCRLVYRFFVPCHVTATAAAKRVVLTTYDSTYYSDISFAGETPVELVGAEPFRADVAVSKNREIAIFFGQINPWALELEFARK